MSRCRLCSTNNLDELIEQVAQEIWRTFPSDTCLPWDDAGSYWQTVMRNHATVTVELLKAGHAG